MVYLFVYLFIMAGILNKERLENWERVCQAQTDCIYLFILCFLIFVCFLLLCAYCAFNSTMTQT